MSELAVDVSVIVPCYDVEATVGQCVGSVLESSGVRLEVIAIDDGSTDGTARVLAELAERDRRLTVVTKPNGGYGAAVNLGLSRARGRYVAIAEPDDWVEPLTYDALYAVAESCGWPDIVKSSYWRVIPDAEGVERSWHNDYFHLIRPPHQPFTLVEQPWILRYHPSIWSCLYRRVFLEERGIRLMEVPGAGWVDNPFVVEAFASADSIAYTDVPYYHYREDLPGSSSTILGWQVWFQRWHDMMDVLDRLGVADTGVRAALTVVGFRYTEKALAVAPDDAEVVQGARRIFERMDPAIIASLDQVSPTLRTLAFELRGEPVPRLSRPRYLRSLVGTGIHVVEINGAAFALDYLGRYGRALLGRLSASRASETP